MSESHITKRAIADSLKELTSEKTFDKISVKDISEKCGINRQTFYYHFEDKFALLEWIYKTDLFDANMEGIDFDNWGEKFYQTLTAMKNDKAFYVNTINHTENYIHRYITEQTQTVFQKAIDILDERKAVDEVQREFIAKFFAYGVTGMVIEWASGGMIKEPEFLSTNMMKLKNSCEKAAYIYITDEVYEKIEEELKNL
ncbi:MAG: TetR/AcrR family transcriptional regulator C-terminal domain-containing protein [Eubacterium sp.]|nr:TetR/AcrR family transcriptional regulator C-terminal domain-containing protein [Eubacterium sp.]